MLNKWLCRHESIEFLVKHFTQPQKDIDAHIDKYLNIQKNMALRKLVHLCFGELKTQQP